jgi:hypothetical protein
MIISTWHHRHLDIKRRHEKLRCRILLQTVIHPSTEHAHCTKQLRSVKADVACLQNRLPNAPSWQTYSVCPFRPLHNHNPFPELFRGPRPLLLH